MTRPKRNPPADPYDRNVKHNSRHCGRLTWTEYDWLDLAKKISENGWFGLTELELLFNYSDDAFQRRLYQYQKNGLFEYRWEFINERPRRTYGRLTDKAIELFNEADALILATA